MSKTFSAKPSDISRDWVLVDASEAPLGRVATVIARHLTGKHKTTYTPHIDGGDYVIVINASKIVATGNKMDAKKYYRYSGYPGGLKETTLGKELEKNPTRIIEQAVKGMLPKNKLARGRLSRLRVFATEEHQHLAQKPKKVEVKRG